MIVGELAIGAELAAYVAFIGGVIGAVYSLYKASPERSKLTAEANAIAVGAQQKIIDDLQSELERARIRIREVKEERDRELEAVGLVAAKEREGLKTEVHQLREINERQQERIARLEARLDGSE